MKLSLVIPCYNEQDNIQLFYECVVETFKDFMENIELIFVNDGSHDKTYLYLETLYKESQYHINVISFSRNFGKEAAILAGLKESQGEYISIIDADLQQHPKYVKQMFQFLEQNLEYDEVAMVQDTRKESKILVFFKECFYKLINRITEVDIARSASDFRMMRRCVVEAILCLPERCRFSKGIFSWVGFNVKYMNYEVQDRAHGQSKWSFWKLFGYAIDGITAFSTTPLVIASILGILICLLSFICILIICVKTIIWGDPVAGFPTLATMILFAMGIQLIGIGILGQYLAKTYTETKARPMYIVKNHLHNKGDNK